MQVCSGKPEEDRGGPISLVTAEEEEDAVVAAIDAGAVPLGPFAWLEDDHGDGAAARWWWSFSVVKRTERGR
jgi:hypothetical protein